MENDLKPGMIVVLKSGSHQMTFGKFGKDDNGFSMATCYWCSGDFGLGCGNFGGISTAEIPLHALVEYQPEKMKEQCLLR